MSHTDAALAVLIENLNACAAGQAEHWWLGAYADSVEVVE